MSWLNLTINDILTIILCIITILNYRNNNFKSIKVRIIPWMYRSTGSHQIGVSIDIENHSLRTIPIHQIVLYFPYLKIGWINRLLYILKNRKRMGCNGAFSIFPEDYGINDKFPISIEPEDIYRIKINHESLLKILKDSNQPRIMISIRHSAGKYIYSNEFVYDWIAERGG